MEGSFQTYFGTSLNPIKTLGVDHSVELGLRGSEILLKPIEERTCQLEPYLAAVRKMDRNLTMWFDVMMEKYDKQLARIERENSNEKLDRETKKGNKSHSPPREDKELRMIKQGTMFF